MHQSSTSPSAEPAPLEIHDLTVAYHKKPVLWGIDLEVPRGKLIGIVGPNGAGKSTLIKAVMGLVPISSGWVKIFGQPVKKNLQRIGYVPQRESVDWDFPVSVMDVVLMGRYGRLGLLKRPSKNDREIARACLEKVHMLPFANRQISNLSGGQQQRVFLARALAQESDLYFMDEPFSGVDAATESAIITLLHELRAQGKTMLVVHHDLPTARQYFDMLILLNLRLVAFGPTNEVFTQELLQTTYGGRLTILSDVAEAVKEQRILGMKKLALGVLVLIALAAPAYADKMSDISSTNLVEQALRFFTFRDPSLRYALIGSLLLGITCGLLGSFIVVRKMALVGDALSHAVLPGVAMGFLWSQTKDPVAIFVGATLAGLIGTTVVSLIKQTTRLKEDAALGLVLASFFAVGICMLTMIQRLPTGNKSGIDKFLFGQAAAIGAGDVRLMAIVAIVSLGAIVLFYKECLVSSFDVEFAGAVGMPTQWIHHGIMLLLAFAIVVALQAVGVVLVSAMLITPAATAYLLTDRMNRMLILAAIFGMLAGVSGAFLSFLGNNLPTGPFMVLAASAIFLAAFLVGPKHGVLMRWWKRRSRAGRIGRENTLKSVYRVLEEREFDGEGVSLRELAESRRESLEEARRETAGLARHGLVTSHEEGNIIFFTPTGWQRACEIVRNHRLWELYLTNAVQFAPDHVHEDADKIEHVLGAETVRQLERRLQFAKRDPHGRLIPGLEDIYPAHASRRS